MYKNGPRQMVKGKRQFVSRRTWEDFYQETIPPGQVIHHRDGDPQNNEPRNLECLTKKEHLRKHNGWQKDICGIWYKNCHKCGILKPESEFYRYPHAAHGVCKKCFCAQKNRYYHAVTKKRRLAYA